MVDSFSSSSDELDPIDGEGECIPRYGERGGKIITVLGALRTSPDVLSIVEDGHVSFTPRHEVDLETYRACTTYLEAFRARMQKHRIL